MSELWKMLDDEVLRRKWSVGQAAITRMVGVYEGRLPPEYSHFFPSDEPAHKVGLIKLAWNDLASQIGTAPELRAETRNHSDAEQKRVSKLEKIGYRYGQVAKPANRLLFWQLGWWLIGTGRAIAIVKPDFKTQYPCISIRDPRTAYPDAASTVGRTITELNDVIFKYEIPKGEAQAMGLKVRDTYSTSYSFPGSPTAVYGDTTDKVSVYEMIDSNEWTITSEGGSVLSGKHGLGRVPAHIFQSFSVDEPWGLSQFEDQITLQVAISRLISLKLAYSERLTYPVYWAKGLTDSIEIGPLVINKLDQTGEMGQLTPPTTLQADRDIEILSGFSRILNRNPEVRQGEIASQGSYTSAKTLEQLASSLDSTVSTSWDVIATGMQYLYSVALQMDEALWPNVERPLGGYTPRGRKIQGDTYIPSKDIKGRYELAVDYGYGLGGYTGFLQRLQAKEAGVMPKRAVIEDMPGVSDPENVMRELELEALDEAAGAQLLAMAQMGALDLVLLGKMRTQMAKGKPLAEVALEIQEEMMKQAEANLAATGGLEQSMTVPEGGGDPAPAGPSGLPPLGSF